MEKRKHMSISIPSNLLERIDTFAERRGINRTAAIMVLVSESLDTYENKKEVTHNAAL